MRAYLLRSCLLPSSSASVCYQVVDDDYTSIMAGLCCGVPSVQEDPSHPPPSHHHQMKMMIIQYSGLANIEKDGVLLPLLHRLCHQQGHEGSIQVLPLTSDILDAVAMVIAIMVFSAHWVTTPRLCPENLELSLSAHSLSSQRIKGDASDHVCQY